MMTLRLGQAQVDQILEQAASGAPAEICGLIAGAADGHPAQIIPLYNRAQNPQKHFDADPIDLLRALRTVDETGQQLIAIYHSHPTSTAIPSQEDIDRARQHYPHMIQLIISLQHSEPQMAAWQITPVSVERVDIEITGSTTDIISSSASLSRAQIWAIILSMAAAVALMLILSLALLPPAPPLPPPAG